ncbi:hypothetical protein [Limosilactobacillus vaginalis]|uniref:hypothetical protein n=1 Tax=Limosilactobacillus vaginalis TaxID=1633 RepID=UPI001DCFC244|nr:hypothetical protein [Limosilactobacillus vaginalis]HJG17631.1 hypothetical protein [Limosilactobacillus vaginalis]
MTFKKLSTTMIAGMMLLSLSACGSQSANQHNNSESSSSKTTSAKVKKSSSTNSQKNSKSSSQSKTNTNSDSSSTNISSSSTSQKSSSSSANSSERVMAASDAKDLVKEFLGNSRADALQSGKEAPKQPSIDSIDGFTAKQNDTNDWTVSGTYNGQSYSYHVTPTSITSAQ